MLADLDAWESKSVPSELIEIFNLLSDSMKAHLGAKVEGYGHYKKLSTINWGTMKGLDDALPVRLSHFSVCTSPESSCFKIS